MKVAVREAKAKLSQFGDIAHNGGTVVVCKHGKPWFDIVPHTPVKRKITPMKDVTPVISESDATTPVAPEDIPGWI